jgi:probable rRNA maturation factor
MPNRPTTTLTILPPLPRRWQNKLARKIRHAVQVTLRGEGLEEPVQVSLVLCDDATIHALNRQFLGHDYPTDVLSFPLNAPTPTASTCWAKSSSAWRPPSATPRRYRQPLERELLHLVIHGILHLLGYDDTTPENRRRMRRKELAYLRKVTGKT